MKLSHTIKASIAAFMLLTLCSAFATTLQEQHTNWTRDAKTANAAFAPSAQRGQHFYDRIFRAGSDMASCNSCHTANPKGLGKHVITGKEIKPLAPSANAERFTDAAKSEKWFKRNCTDVIGRECTAAEKSDLAAWLLQN